MPISRYRRESKTTSQTSLVTSSGGGSAAGDLAADLKQLNISQQPTGLTVPSPSQPSSGHSSRLMSPAPSSGSSIRSPIVGIHSRALVKRLQENGSGCSIHSAGSASSSVASSPGRLVGQNKKGGLNKRTKTLSGGSSSSGEGAQASQSKSQTNQGSAQGGRASVHFAEGEAGNGGMAAGTGTGNGNVNGTPRRQRPGFSRNGESRSFDAYMTLDQVQRGLRRGELIEGVLRINPKRYEDAYIAAPDGAMDIYICGRLDQRGALNGDTVAVQLLPLNEWKIMHERVLDTLPKLTKEQFRELYANKDFSSRPEVAEMVDMARRGLLMDFNLLDTDDVDDSSVAGMIGGSFSDPSAIFGSRYFHPGEDTDDEDPGEKSEPPDGQRVKILDLRKSEKISEDEDDCDVIIDKSSDEERVEGNCYFGESDDDGQATPLPTPTSVAVPPDEFLGSPPALSESDGDNDVSDGEVDAVQRVEDKEFFQQSTSGVSGGVEVVPERADAAVIERVDENQTNEPKVGCDSAAAAEEIENSDDYEDVDDEPVAEGKQGPSPKGKKKNRRKERCRSKKSKQAEESVVEVRTLEIVEVVSTPAAQVETKVTESDVKVGRRRSNRRGNDKYKRKEFDVKQVKLDCGLTPSDLIKLSNWGQLIQRRGRVVAITKRNHSSRAIGFFKSQATPQRQGGTPGEGYTPGRKQHTLFSPIDSRIPRIKIPVDPFLTDILQDPERCQKSMFMARIVKWNGPEYALGELVTYVGETGDIQVETTAILLQNGIDDSDFPNSILDSLPPQVFEDQRSRVFRFPEEEYRRRKDLTTMCVFTVDPETARDLDDAVSMRTLSDGTYEVGVHIADVSYYIPEGSSLDQIASQRATSVYMVQRVIPMLPRPLCEHLCSLNPGEPKLTFSVIWRMKADGTVIDYWMGRSIINSVCKLSYGHAQAMIECEDETKLKEADFPPIHGGYDLGYLAQRVKELNAVALHLRKRRFSKGGALSLDIPKVAFQLDPDTCLPETYDVYDRKESHKMIEEFMLMANMTVAEFLHLQVNIQPALLRRHAPPNPAQLSHIVHTLRLLGRTVDASSAKALHDTLVAIRSKDPAAYSVMTFLFAKPMKVAEYFLCIKGDAKSQDCHHFALNVDFYTHFTSPIRRYADVLVHRLLGAALRIAPRVTTHFETLKEYTQNCNAKKEAAKRCSEESVQLYFNLYLTTNGPIITDAVVTAVNDRSFDVFLPKIGSTGRVYIDKIGMKSCNFSRDCGRCTLSLVWTPASGDVPIRQKIQVFDELCVQLLSNRNSGKFMSTLVPPDGAVVTRSKSQEKREDTPVVKGVPKAQRLSPQ